MWLISGKRRVAAEWDLSLPLVRWSRREQWSLREAVEGCLILGATGSGKSSGSGLEIARAFLTAGFGGLVLTAKADECERWREYCKRTGRADDLLIFGPDSKLTFNFLDHELQRKGAGGGLTENIVNLFSTVLEIAERSGGQSAGREDEGFWRRALRQLCRNLTDLLVLATGRVSIPELYALLVSAPVSLEQTESTEWRKRSLLMKHLAAAEGKPKTPQQQRDLELAADYFLLEFPALSDKTRSVVVATFTSMIDVLNRGLLRDVFCGRTNVAPEAAEAGKIILINFPVKEFGEVGQIAQVLWKYAFQRSIERRNLSESPRPVFLWCDEAQYFVTGYDSQFQTTCRAARVATVLLSQNVSNFYAALGGREKGRAEADSLFGNLNTKIFHANTDPVTNDWAASLIGRTRQYMANASSSQSADWLANLVGFDNGGQSSAGVSEVYEYEVQPAEFTMLRTGGRINRGLVDALIVQSGRKFRETGGIWLPVTFRQS